MNSKKIKTEWNLNVLYKNGSDPQIERDVVQYEKMCEDFEKKYKNRTDYLESEEKLSDALKEYEKFLEIIGHSKPYNYFYFRKDINGQDQEAEAKLNQLTQRLTKASNKTLFFRLALGKIEKNKQKEILKNKKLAHYHYFLEVIFKSAQHTLTEPEEKILNLKALPSHSLWVRGQQKLLNQQTIIFKGKVMAVSEAYERITTLPTKDRRALSDMLYKKLREVSDFSESEINAIYTDKKISDELRGFKEPYSATILSYENDEKSIMNLVETVTQHFSISQRFYKLKAKLHNLNYLEYADRAAPVGKLKVTFSFEDSLQMLRKAFAKAGSGYVEILNRYIEKGQIDVYPKKGKKGGAYCSGQVNLPTFVLLNHVGSFRSLTTFAHEMGHAFHTELSKSQPLLYQDYTTSVAEVASTFFENFAFDEVFSKLSKKEQIVALHDKINDSIGTIFRQIACFNYELEMHKTIREKGSISKEDMAALHNKHMKAYLGPIMRLKENDGYMFVNWPHLRYSFYVYSYAYGEIISKALYAKYKEDPHYMKEIKSFLSAGGSKSPEQIFKDIGIDTSKPEFFVKGLKSIEEDIKELEKLVS
ncbi:M3 family oligoendopeptidase [Candidatus Parcubacteria bacterium]|nr:M3 family oligoendopeptidase [Candidatus Parcubacteria bacterium]